MSAQHKPVTAFDLEGPLSEARCLANAVALIAMNTYGPEADAMFHAASAARNAAERADCIMRELMDQEGARRGISNTDLGYENR